MAHYKSLLRLSILPQLGECDIARLRPIEVGEWVSGLSTAGKSPSWVRKSYRLLAQVLSAAVDNDVIVVSPCRGHRLPRLPAPDPHILTVEEVERLIAASAGPSRLLLQLLAYGGVRIGEVLPLRRNDVSSDGRLIRVDERQAEVSGHLDYDDPKAHQHRSLTLPAYLAALVRDHLASNVGQDPEAFLFTGRTGTALRYGSWRRWQWLPAVEAAGLVDLTPHDLRATHATWVAESHGVMVAAQRLGHSNANVTTRHYARAVDGRDAEVAETFQAAHERAAIARGSHDLPVAPSGKDRAGGRACR